MYDKEQYTAIPGRRVNGETTYKESPRGAMGRLREGRICGTLPSAMPLDIESELLRRQSRAQADRLAAWVGADPRRFRRLVRCLTDGDPVVTQRSAWVVSLCSERHPGLVIPHLPRLIARMQEPGVHDAVRRNVIRILQTVDIPPRLQGPVAEVCFRYLTAVDTPVAVRVFSMTVLAGIAGRHPDLKRELRLVIEQMVPYGSPGIQARARRVLRQLNDRRAAPHPT